MKTQMLSRSKKLVGLLSLIFVLCLSLFDGQLFASVEVISSSENELKVRVEIPQLRINERIFFDGNTYGVIHAPSAAQLSIGSPDVPGFGSWILIPNGRQVSISVDEGTPVIYENINLAPVQPPASDAIGAEEPPFTKNDVVFSKNADYPGVFARTEPVKYKRGQSCTILWIYPYQYNPVEKTLAIYSDLEITVEFSGETEPIPSNLINKNTNKLLHSMAINAEAVLTAERQAFNGMWEGKSNVPGCEMLIITHPDFQDAADTLAQWKRRKGISTIIKSFNTTDPFLIEDSIDHAFLNWNPAPSYLLFIGDDEYVPTWHVDYHPDSASQGRVGTDLFYADYNDPPDHTPDFGYGRLAISTSAQADSIVERIIRFESSPPTISWYYDDAYVVSYFQDDDNDSIADRRFAKTSEDVGFFNLNAFVGHRIYCTNSSYPKYWNYEKYLMENDSTTKAGAELPAYLQNSDIWTGNAAKITQKVNSGTFFLFHRDHGGRQVWGDPHFDVDDVDALNNGERRPVVWSINCQTGWFDNQTDSLTFTGDDEECFAEHWLMHNTGGSCGIIAATRTSWSGINDALAWGYMDAVWPAFTTFYNDPYGTDDPVYRMGDVVNYGKEYMSQKFDGGWEPYKRRNGWDYRRQITMEMYHYFGDPTMEMWTQQPVVITSVDARDAIVEGADKVGIKVSPAVEDMLVAVYSEDKKELYGVGYTDADGEAVIALDTIVVLDEKLRLTASKHDYLPKDKIYTVGAGESGYITANRTWSDDTIKVIGDIFVEEDVTLTINAGVYVEFQGHYDINVFGRLLAQGTKDDSIVFFPKSTTTAWHGIRFFNTDISGQSQSKLVYCRLQHGKAEWAANTNEGNGGAVFCLKSSGVLIDQCLISQNEANSGGAVYCYDSDIEIKNTKLNNNSSGVGGGLTCTVGSNPVLYNVEIIGNDVTEKGGGLFCYFKSSPELTKVYIDNNSAGMHGGGVYLEGDINDWPEPVFDSVKITNNSAELRGGGIYSKNRSKPFLKHTQITGNIAGKYGGGMACYYSWPDLNFVTISGNVADSSGGGISCFNQSGLNIENSILWDDSPDEVYIATLGGSPTVTYSDVEGTYSGTGNINSDPLFYATTGDSAYYLTIDSPCLDAGDPYAPHDPDGSTADMGAYYYYHTEIIYPPTANFEADTTYGWYPATIAFTDLSQQGTAAIKKWDWDFGDSSTDTLQNPSHTYTTDGTFTVTLIVTDDNELKDTLVMTDLITTVAAPPIADFSADTTEWYKPLKVDFTDESTDGSEGIDNWDWDFGDLSTSDLQNPTHTYADTGTYTVSLTVTDINDSTDTKIKTDYITVLPGTYIAGGYVSGTWTKANEPYVIGGEITVHADSSLTIDPGVELLFLDHYKFIVDGTLTAQGNVNDSIVFTTRDNRQGWHGLRFYNSSSSVLSYCHIKNGAATGTSTVQDSCGGAIYCENSPLQITHCFIENNIAYKNGGGIYCEDSDIQISHSKLLFNTAFETGGGIYSLNSGITSTGDTLERNEADMGGGIYCEGNPFPVLMEAYLDKNIAFTSGGGVFCMDFGSIDIQESTFSENVANTNGAGMYIGNNSNPVLTGVRFENNNAGSKGGGMFFNGTSAPVLSGLSVNDNSAAQGGGIYFNGFNDPNLVLFDLPVTMNSAGQGGGIYYNNSTGPALDNVSVIGNSAGGENAFGGGIYFNQSSPNITNLTLRLNTAFSYQIASGGGMYLYNSSSPQLNGCTINSNSANGRMISTGGGMVCDYNCNPVAMYITICHNITACEQSPALGGGMYCTGGSVPYLEKVTIANNTAQAGAGGGIHSNGSGTNPTLKNSIMWDDIPQEIASSAGGSVTATWSDIEGGLTGTGNKNLDPLFSDPMNIDYQITWPNYPVPSGKSPCIDAGDPSSLFDPDATRADMGAFFYNQMMIPEAFDFGDCPDPNYPTKLINNGARHFIDSYVYLGNSIDADENGQPNTHATGDDNDGNNDDDGVVFNPELIPGTSVDVTVTASVGGYLNAWCDFNADGNWDDAAEQIFSDEPLTAGVNSLNFSVPATACIDTTYCRYRFNTTGGLDADGEAGDGEVEDYQVIIAEESYEDIAIWHFDENQGATAFDATGNNNNGTISGASWTTGCNGTPALEFNGGKVVVPHSPSLDIAGPFSVQAWIICTGQGNYYAIMDKYTYHESGSTGFTFYLSSGKLRFSIYSGANGNGGKMGTINLRDGMCHHVFASWDGDSIRLYVDGIPDGKVAWAHPPASTTASLGIGQRLSGWGGYMPFQGTIDEVMISSDPCLRRDLGDAPDPTYPTLLTNNGAYHLVNPDVHLGEMIDAETNGIPDGSALGDDNSGYDDEDGVFFTSAIIPGKQACLEILASVDGVLNAWMDFNIDGDWADAGEQIFIDQTLNAGNNSLSFLAPVTAVPGNTFSRFRFSLTGGVDFEGFATGGEVEDYMVEITGDISAWNDGLETYSDGSDIVGQGGWEAWGGASASPSAVVTGENSYSGYHSVKILGKADQTGDDILHQFCGCSAGLWELSAWQFIPSNAAGGSTYFILLNQYDCSGVENNWSAQIKFDPSANVVESDYDGSTLPLMKGEWVKICVIIDLDNNSQSIYYNGKLLATKSWTEGVSGGGISNIAALNLFSNTLENTCVYYDDILLRPLGTQELSIVKGWSGISSRLELPVDNVETIFDPVSGDLEIVYNQTGVFWPGQNLNSIGNWDEASGYITKMNEDVILTLTGCEMQNRTVYLVEGWNLIPVYGQVHAMSTLGSMSGFVVAKGISTFEILWPMFGIETLSFLHPGKSYLVCMSQPGSFSYPAGDQTNKHTEIPQPQPLPVTPWNRISITPVSHVVAFTQSSLESFEKGDIIAAFTQDDLLAGAAEIIDVSEPLPLILYGDDPLTPEVDGFITGETISFRCYQPEIQQSVGLELAYHADFDHSGEYVNNGLSVVTALTPAQSGGGKNQSPIFQIYPNPSEGLFHIGGIGQAVQVKVYNSFGRVIFNKEMVIPNKLDLSGHAKGVYFIRIVSGNKGYFEKLMIR